MLNLKPKALLSFAGPLFLSVALLFTGCIAADESELVFDQPIGANYTPRVTRDPVVWPQRVLILPVSGPTTDEARAEFERQFLAQIKDRLPWAIFLYDDADSTQPSLHVSASQALMRAQEVHADAILQINLNYQQVYSPLRLIADVTMEQVPSQTIFYKMRADFDARDQTVANSARRYYQNELQTRHLPDRSLSILNDMNEFLRFTGWYAGKLVADSYITPSKTAVKTPTPKPEPQSGGTTFQSPPPQNPPNQ